MQNATSLKNYADFKQKQASRSTGSRPVDGVWNPPLPLLCCCWGQPWYAFVNTVFQIYVVLSSLNLTRTLQRQKQYIKKLIFLFLLLFFFVGMELVSTKPTKPTCSYVLNKRLFIFFFSFVCFCLLQVCMMMMMVCRTTNREREREREKQIDDEEKQEKGGRTRERQRKWEKGQSEGEKQREEEEEEEEERLKYDSGSMILDCVFHCRVCCEIVTVESFCALPPFGQFLKLSVFFCCFFHVVVCLFVCLFLNRFLKQRSTTVTWSYKHVRRNKKCRLA